MIATGLDRFSKGEYRRYRKTRVGILCHSASVDATLSHISTTLPQKKFGLNVTCLFGPQHGIRAEKQDNMIESSDFRDGRSGLPVFSLYSSTREPTDLMFSNIDVLLVDLQDIGTRIYTFMYTLAGCMRAAKRLQKRIVVLDRPNPIGGSAVDGNVLETGFESFVGQFPISTRHGMTLGELACLFNEGFGIGCDLEVIEVRGWKRSQDATLWHRDWIPPSPNIPSLTSAQLFPGMVHFEGTNVSEGRGTCKPFEWIGAPYIEDPDGLAKEMNLKKLPGVHFRPLFFQPSFQKWSGEVCGGVQVHVLDAKRLQATRTGWHLLESIARLYTGKFEWKQPPYEYEYERLPIDLIAGTSRLRVAVTAGSGLKAFEAESKLGLQEFLKRRRRFLLYG